MQNKFKQRNSHGWCFKIIWFWLWIAGRIDCTNTISKKRLFKEHIKENKCEICGITEWNNKPIICQLHHKDGNHLNNNLENLQILCPNCHSQTDNYCGNSNKVTKKNFAPFISSYEDMFSPINYITVENCKNIQYNVKWI